MNNKHISIGIVEQTRVSKQNQDEEKGKCIVKTHRAINKSGILGPKLEVESIERNQEL